MVWCLGSIIIFLATALDPFAQQLVSYPDVRQDNMGIASVGKSFRYKGNDTAFYLPDGRLDSNSLGNLPDRDILKAINTGIFGDPTQIEPTCATRNCDFDPFTSLAVCSHCTSGTGAIDYNAESVNYTSPSNLRWSEPMPEPVGTANVGVWTPEADVTIADMRSPLVGFAQFPQGPYSADAAYRNPVNYYAR